MQLDCVASGSPEPEYRWERNGLPFNPGDHGDRIIIHNGSDTITFNQAIDEDQAYYQCFAENGHGVSLSVKTYLMAAKLDPFPAGRPKTIQADPGEAVFLQCIPPRSIPRPAIYWVIDDGSGSLEPMTTDKRVTINQYGDLLFTNVRKSDERGGRGYSCLVTNHVLRVMVSDHPTYIQVRDGPERLSPPQMLWSSDSDNLALTGQDLKLQCVFAGNPTPEVTWEWDRWDSFTQIYTSDGGTALEFKNVTLAVSGTYTCRGQNTQSSAVSEKRMNVIVEEAPFWTTRLQDQEVRVGESVQFKCGVWGSPIPTSQWFIDGIPISESSRASRINSVWNTLRLLDVRSDDNLNVQCNMSNKHGYVFGEASLKLDTRPAPSNVSVETGLYSATVTWIPLNSNQPQQQFVWFRALIGGLDREWQSRLVPGNNARRFYLYGLQIDTLYEFKVESRDHQGEGIFSSSVTKHTREYRG